MENDRQQQEWLKPYHFKSLLKVAKCRFMGLCLERNYMWYFVNVSNVNKGGNNGEDVVKLIFILHS
jgi:hypothetical protein